MVAQFLEENQVINASVLTTAGTSLITSSAWSIAGFDEITIIVTLGTATDAGTAVVQLYGVTTKTASGGTAITTGVTPTYTFSTSSNLLITLDVMKPSYPFYYCTVARATQNTSVNAILVFLSRAKNVPVTKDASVGQQTIVLATN